MSLSSVPTLEFSSTLTASRFWWTNLLSAGRRQGTCVSPAGLTMSQGVLCAPALRKTAMNQLHRGATDFLLPMRRRLGGPLRGNSGRHQWWRGSRQASERYRACSIHGMVTQWEHWVSWTLASCDGPLLGVLRLPILPGDRQSTGGNAKVVYCCQRATVTEVKC